MECRNQRIAGPRTLQQIPHASLHLVRGFVGERDGKNGLRPDLQVVDQVRDAIGDDARLAAAGARENEHRSFGCLHGFELLRIEKLA